MNDGHPYRARGAGWDGLTRDEKHFYLWTLLVSTAAVVVAICVGAVIHG